MAVKKTSIKDLIQAPPKEDDGDCGLKIPPVSYAQPVRKTGGGGVPGDLKAKIKVVVAKKTTRS